MQIGDVLQRLEAVRSTTRGWTARCPAHSDRFPSLSIRVIEGGRILLYCFAGCTLQEIRGALGVQIKDLFPAGTKGKGSLRRVKRPIDWRKVAAVFEDHALSLWHRADGVLKTAQGLDTSGWTATDRDLAMRAVVRAYDDLERADLLQDVAFAVRRRGLEERNNHVHDSHGA